MYVLHKMNFFTFFFHTCVCSTVLKLWFNHYLDLAASYLVIDQPVAEVSHALHAEGHQNMCLRVNTLVMHGQYAKEMVAVLYTTS
jgi:hypothetical protein